MGDGLIWILGEWSQVFSLRKKSIKVASDARVLEEDEFVHILLWYRNLVPGNGNEVIKNDNGELNHTK